MIVDALVGCSLIGQNFGQFDCSILTYHDMVPVRDKSALWFDCTPQELESQIAAIKKSGAQFVGLKTVMAAHTLKRRYAKPAICITFADNYEGFRTYAWPILKKHKIPVTMFVHTGHVGSQKGRTKMSWSTLRELCTQGGFSVGSQTVSHPADLTKLSDASLKKEFVNSDQVLKKQLGDSYLRIIAYPNGKFDRRVARVAEEVGYLYGFTEEQLPVSKAPNDFMIPRYVHTKWKEALAAAQKARSMTSIRK